MSELIVVSPPWHWDKQPLLLSKYKIEDREYGICIALKNEPIPEGCETVTNSFINVDYKWIKGPIDRIPEEWKKSREGEFPSTALNKTLVQDLSKGIWQQLVS